MYEAEYCEHVAVSRTATDGGYKYKKKCVYCAARAETAKQAKQRLPTAGRPSTKPPGRGYEKFVGVFVSLI